MLKVAGPPLHPGSRLGWSVHSARVRISEQGRYQGRIETVTPVGLGRQIGIRIGDGLVYALAGYADYNPGNLCRVDIDPECASGRCPSG